MWFSGLILLFLLTGLPWTQLWGGGFDYVQSAMNWGGPGQEWRITLQSGEQPKTGGLNMWSIDGDQAEVSLQSIQTQGAKPVTLQTIITKSEVQALSHPIKVQPPKANNGVWSVRSMTQYRPDRVTLHYDQWTAEPIMRIGFEDYHPVK
jgi:uncharacterized iron-regulated membrane protein